MSLKNIVLPDPSSGLKPVKGQQLRELNSDTTVYALEGHTPTHRHLLTVTSKLPTPRKGNPGTVKTTVHLLADQEISVVGSDGNSITKMVPTITKIETSYPVGTDAFLCQKEGKQLAAFLLSDTTTFQELFNYGLPISLK